MKYYLYAVRDKFRGFMQPLMDVNDLAAKRAFAVGINQAGASEMGYAPSDFDLNKIGEFDSVSGILTPIIPIEFVCNGIEVFNEK